jgi:hypothetical protein
MSDSNFLRLARRVKDIEDAYEGFNPEDYLPLGGGQMTGVITTPNNTVGINIGNDARLADRNIANTMFVEGQQNSDRGYINFSQTSGNALGAVNGGNLTWRGNQVWDAAGLPYETGTWTPTLSGATTAGSPTYTTRSATYTRIGDRVFLSGNVSISDKGGMDGDLRLTGFPFTQRPGYNTAGYVGQTGWYSGVRPGLQIDQNSNRALICKLDTAFALQASEIGNEFALWSFVIVLNI